MFWNTIKSQVKLSFLLLLDLVRPANGIFQFRLHFLFLLYISFFKFLFECWVVCNVRLLWMCHKISYQCEPFICIVHWLPVQSVENFDPFFFISFMCLQYNYNSSLQCLSRHIYQLRFNDGRGDHLSGGWWRRVLSPERWWPGRPRNRIWILGKRNSATSTSWCPTPTVGTSTPHSYSTQYFRKGEY